MGLPIIAALPVIEMGLTEAPKLIQMGIDIVNGLKGMFHKSPGTPFPPGKVSQIQAMSLAGMRARLLEEFPDMSKNLTDAQIQMFIEVIYQTQKVTAAPTTPVALPAVVSNIDATAMTIARVIVTLLNAFATPPPIAETP